MNNLYRSLMERRRTSILRPRVLLRCAVMMAVMIFVGGGTTWGQVSDGVYYITNTDDPGNLPNPNPSGYDRWYLWPSVTTNSQTGKQYLTTFYDAQAPACNESGVSYGAYDNTYSHWVVKNLNDGTGRFQLINPKLNKYIVIRSKAEYGDRDVWLDNEPTGNEIVRSYFKLNGSSSPYLISPTINATTDIANATEYTTGTLTLNSAKGNKRYLCSTDNGQTPKNIDQRQGLLQFYDNAPTWTFTENKLPAPTISDVSATNTITITDANGLPEGYTIRYTTDGTDPTTSTVTIYSEPIIVEEGMTVKAVVVRYGIVLTSIAEKSVSSVIAAPTITNNYDGTISLSTTTPDATIYYTINGDTPDNTSTAYSSPFSLGDATIIKAIAYLDSDYSNVSIYNVPRYTTPTISFDDNTSDITITSEGTVYYNTGDGSQDDPTPSPENLYSGPFAIDPDITVKAIATHPGYLNSNVAIWPTEPEHDYSQDYLTFRILTGGTISWKAFGEYTKTIEYSINNGGWTSITSTSDGTTFDVETNNVVRFRGNNTEYATSKSNYSGFEGGTANFDIEGNIHSLLYGDDFASHSSLTNSTYQFCSLFKKAKVISAENLILPATTLKDYCYRALFSYCTTLTTPPALPATALAQGCYWYMFEKCEIEEAPELNATTLVKECYGHMFENCQYLNYIKCAATSGFGTKDCLLNWVLGVSSQGRFVNEPILTWEIGNSGIPSGWTYNAYLFSPEISCDGQSITITCASEGASIFYRLNQTGNFSLYSSAIPVNSTTTVEAYSSKGDVTSNTVTYTFEIFDNPFDESNRSIDSWTYGGTQVTVPYSVNGINGHSSSYWPGTYAFETTITLYTIQPTYLWFQHADQSADIYVNNEYVTTHWGGYNAFFVDITNHIKIGTNKIKVILNNKTRNTLAPSAGDFNFNATLGKVKLLTSPVLPSVDYGYDGFHITATDVSNSSATINVKTKIPGGASVVCTISDGTYYWTDTQNSTGDEQTFTTTIQNPHLWNGTIDPHLYKVTLEIYKDDKLYHRYERPYGLRYYEYAINREGILPGGTYTGFLLNGQPCLLRGVCMHHDIEGKANALSDEDIANDFAIIKELGCNFVRLAHYPHPKEIYDWCDSLGIIVQTEVPCVNRFNSPEGASTNCPQDYYVHLDIQYTDMVRQHYNHPCILFWGLFNEATTDNSSWAGTKLDYYRTLIKNIDAERWVGYVVAQDCSNPSSDFGNPAMDWFGCNIYIGWYRNNGQTHGTLSNDPTTQLNTRVTNIINNKHKPLAYSEYGCGGTQHCHSDNFTTTTDRGNKPRHDIEYQMWLHEGHIAAIKNKPELLFTSQWQLFDIAVSSRPNDGYKVCFDGGETVFDNNELKYLNNKGLVERDHKTKKDTYYLYKAWWNPTDNFFVHICGKDYKKRTERAIKCYTNETVGNSLSLYVNNSSVPVETVTVTNNTNNIVTFQALDFNAGDVIKVEGTTIVNGKKISDTFTFTNFSNDNVFMTNGNWNEPDNWSGPIVPANGSDVVIMAKATVPSDYIANADNIDLYGGTLTIADGGQLYHNNEGVTATVQKSITAYTVQQNQGNTKTDGWHLIGSPSTENIVPSEDNGFLTNNYDLYFYDESTHYWRNHRLNGQYANFNIEPLNGYLYANSQNVTLVFQGNLRAGNATVNAPLSYTSNVSNVTGFNLVGNPFAHNVTGFTGSNISSEVYRMNDYKTDLVVSEVSGDTPLLPGEGFFVKATGDNASITFNNNAKGENVKHNHIALEISENGKLIDRFILKQDGESLEKFTLNENGTKIFATRNQQDWAVVTKEGNEQAVNFKAAKNGTYTITVNPENVEMDYLHLIDNMTGADINLLSEGDCGSKPAMTAEGRGYTFEAKTTDYESRFKLLFAAKNEDGPSTSSGTFAFISNGNIIITTDVEDATLQVIDVMGRVIVSVGGRTASVPTAGMTAGIYMLRLINGNEVKTQKIVIK